MKWLFIAKSKVCQFNTKYVMVNGKWAKAGGQILVVVYTENNGTFSQGRKSGK